jgi:hypothetical protein
MFQIPKLATREVPRFMNLERMTPDFSIYDHAGKPQNASSGCKNMPIVFTVAVINWLSSHATNRKCYMATTSAA